MSQDSGNGGSFDQFDDPHHPDYNVDTDAEGGEEDSGVGESFPPTLPYSLSGESSQASDSGEG